MKAAGLAVLGVAATTAVVYLGAAQRDETTTSRTLRFNTGADRIVDLRVVTGSIQVTGYDGADVQVEARRTIEADNDAARQAAEQEVTLNFEDGGSRVSAIVRDAAAVCGERDGWNRDWRRRRYQVTFDLTVRVPRDARLRVCAINGGAIRVNGTAGDFDVSNVNGAITMTGIRGSGSATTVNGRVETTFLETPQMASVFKTVNGDVDVTFPASLAAEFTLKTMHGDLLTDFDVELLPPRVSPAERRNGGFVYRSGGQTRVRVGQGGPDIGLETLNGDVRIRRATR